MFGTQSVERVWHVPISTYLCPSDGFMNKLAVERRNYRDHRALSNYGYSIGPAAMPSQAGSCNLLSGNFLGNGAAGHGNSSGQKDVAVSGSSVNGTPIR